MLVHGIHGYEEHMKDVARRFAVLGCASIVPALYSRDEFLSVVEEEDLAKAGFWLRNRTNAQMGRFRCGAEPFEGPAMTKACIDLLGTSTLMHQSDYSHGEAHFPDTAGMVIDWPFWKELGTEALQKHMSGNAEQFLRLI